MLKKVPIICYAADPHSQNQPSGLFQVRLDGVYFPNFRMLANIRPLPLRFDGKTLVDCGVFATH